MAVYTIKNADPDIIPSPIQPLIKEFLNAPYIWIPEKREMLLQLQEKHQIRIVVDALDQTFRFSAKSEKQRVTVGLTAMERVWCYCFGLLKLYNFCRTQGAGHLINTNDFPELNEARFALGAALTSEKNKTHIEWNRQFPCPLLDSDMEDVKKTHPVFTSVAAFLLLHEIGHIHCKHATETYVSLEDKRDQEFEADLWAMRFIMDDLKSYNPSVEHFVSRANGIVLGLCILSSVELREEETSPDYHPGIPERLLRFLDLYLPDHDKPTGDLKEQPKFLAATILYAFLLENKIDLDYAKKHPNFFDPIIDVRKCFPG